MSEYSDLYDSRHPLDSAMLHGAPAYIGIIIERMHNLAETASQTKKGIEDLENRAVTQEDFKKLWDAFDSIDRKMDEQRDQVSRSQLIIDMKSDIRRLEERLRAVEVRPYDGSMEERLRAVETRPRDNNLEERLRAVELQSNGSKVLIGFGGAVLGGILVFLANLIVQANRSMMHP